ncbi:MAG: hypothetical protein IPO15_14815 [Anaerolineae bacterium]|uniref:hypothetical protein n=1 Tax=Candidatus Amarolinea dominans TaxID=3140696 RepID=UPI0031355F10|nr:hypothetical protein [Anaerolineae bacterium]
MPREKVRTVSSRRGHTQAHAAQDLFGPGGQVGHIVHGAVEGQVLPGRQVVVTAGYGDDAQVAR